MDLPEYVTVEEVKRVCQELKISDWTVREWGPGRAKYMIIYKKGLNEQTIILRVNVLGDKREV